MACCLTAPCHWINQCWLPISQVLWHSIESNFTGSGPAAILYEFICYPVKIIATSPRGQWVNSKYCPEDGNPQLAWFKKQVCQCIHKISKCHWLLDNEHRNPIINRVDAPIKVNDCTKYEQDPLNIVGCRVVTMAGQTDVLEKNTIVLWWE